MLRAHTKQPKKPAPAATTASKKAPKKDENSLFQRTPKNFGIGNNVQPRKDLSRMVKMPKNVRLQRQRRILYQRLKVPPAITQFTKTVDKNTGMSMRLMHALLYCALAFLLPKLAVGCKRVMVRWRCVRLVCR